MKIVIAGAGEVGLHLSKLLSSESHDITLIDNNEISLKDGENYLDIKVIDVFFISQHIKKIWCF